MQPLVFETYMRPQVWGGRRLGELLGKSLPGSGTFGEAWELSGHPLHVSFVAEGPLRGTSLNDLCAHQGKEIFGSNPEVPFPLLVKLLDAHDHLSIQVHPDDALAARLRPGEKGKTEAWVVLNVAAGGTLYTGLKKGITRDILEKHLNAGTLEQCLHAYTPRVGDCIFLEAGTVHAIGAGLMLAEVQQTSDVTFRLYDWNRMGSDGKPRPLHVEESLASIDWNRGPVNPVEPAPMPGLPDGIRGEHLVSCPYFRLERFRLSTAMDVQDKGEFSIWVVLAGSADLVQPAGSYRRPFRAGETVLIPAAARGCRWVPTSAGSATLLCARPG